MEWVQVLEWDEGIAPAVRRGLAVCGGGQGRDRGHIGPALLVVSPRAAERGLALPARCQTVLLPGDAGGRLGGLRAASAVSYGVSSRDSLTLSSRGRGGLWAALQRELVTVKGQVVEQQEFPLPLPPDGEVLPMLAAAGALLLLGAAPEQLWNALRP
jgi:hypothetical protein